jgi:NADH dehydrogenase
MRVDSVCIVGGTGFVGRHIANRLANTDVRIRVLTRRRERHRYLLPIPNLELVEADVHSQDSLAEQIQGFDAVINLVGVLNDSRTSGAGFQEAHVELPRRLISVCREVRVGRLLHMSALGAAADAPSQYQKSKAEGERLVLDAQGENLNVTVFRPSVIFGQEDSFLNKFADLLKLAPVMFLPTPDARFKPVYVGDVSQAFVQSLNDRKTFGRSYDLCGPGVYTLRELVDYVNTVMELNRPVIGLGDGLSRLQAKVLQHVPGKPYTYDNYLSSQVDNICSEDGLAELGIHPTAMEAVVPGYLGRVRQRQRYNEFRRVARRGE